MSNIEPTSKSPIYGGKDWSVVGLANEHIIATGIFFYDMANIAPSCLQFCEAFCSGSLETDQYDIDSAVNAYSIEYGKLEEDGLVLQELGSIGIKDGQCVVFPNTHLFKVPELKLTNKIRPGHCKMLTFYFVDPSTRIPLTEIVPPQQQDWHFEDVLVSEPFHSLPHLVVDGIMAKIDFPISLKEAKKLHPQVHLDKNSKDITFDFFEPNLCFSR